MKYYLGIDTGSVTAAFTLIDVGGNIVQSDYRFHKGKIADTLKNMLSSIPLNQIISIGSTSSTSQSFKADYRYDNQVAIITTANQLYDKIGSLLFVGGEKFGLLRFDNKGNYSNLNQNTSCAAGTGSFLDQQVGRLNLEDISEFCRITKSNEDPVPKIASRCAVFAKTDLIHAQQEGYSLPAICEGLCKGLAQNLVNTLFTGQEINHPLVFCGGVSLNPIVKKYIEDLSGETITVDNLSHLYGAYGAALNLLKESHMDKKIIKNNDELFIKSSRNNLIYHQPLELKLSTYPDFSSRKNYKQIIQGEYSKFEVEVDLYAQFQKECRCFLGVDIGSTSTKAVLLNEKREVLAGFYTGTSGKPLQAVKGIFEVINSISLKENTQFTVLSSGATGSGRKFIGKIIGSDLILDEITAHARAAFELDRSVDTIIEIGGQDSKFTTVRNGIVTTSTMNNVCAAGTGSFLEEQAKKRNCKVTDYAGRTMNIQAPVSSDRCTVFMERDMNHFLNEGSSVNEVLGSAIHSVRENYLQKVASMSLIGHRIYFQGATARNKALVAAFEQKLNKPIMVSKFCHLTGALGVALKLCDEGLISHKFRGFQLYKQNIPVVLEICDLCTNHCKISIADVYGEKEAYGFLCGRDYNTKQYINRNNSGFDLFKERKKIFQNIEKKPVAFPFTIGIPAALHLAEELPLWKNFFNLLGIKTISTENLKDPVLKGKIESEAEFCAPVTALYGHTQYLLRKADYLFMPIYLERKRTDKDKKRKYCYYTQFAPTIIKSHWDSTKILSPVLRHNFTGFFTKTELYKMFHEIDRCNLSFLKISNAYDEAVTLFRNQQEKLKDLFRPETEDDLQVVLLGRPYTVLSPSMNKGIPDYFSSLGVRVSYQDMVPVNEEAIKKIEPLLKEIPWNYAAKIIETAQTISSMKNVYPVLITSFKCSPDSYITTYMKKLLEAQDKPYLILELDEHDSSVGYETRIEAAVRAFKNHNNISGRKLKSKDSISPDFTKRLRGKTILLPNWDNISCIFIAAILNKDGYDTRVLEETEDTIRQSLKNNSGQCIPMNAITEGAIQYVKKYNLNPSKTVLWMGKSEFACNIPLYPYHIQTLMREQGEGIEKIGIYRGHVSFADISPRISLNVYFAYMIGGYIRRMGCRLRPYELKKGETDRIEQKSIKMMTEAFLGRRKRENAVEEIITMFESINVKWEEKPKVAIFGDFYVRDNDIMNQDLIHFIENNGGEVITTPYNEYAKIIAEAHFKRLFKEKRYKELLVLKPLLKIMKSLEKSTARQFSRVLEEPKVSYEDPQQQLLEQLGLRMELSGESTENIWKICHLKKNFPELSLFIQTNPAFCCAGIVTEAMRTRIEEITDVPVISITYDGTGGNKNEAIIPFLKFPRKKEKESAERKWQEII